MEAGAQVEVVLTRRGRRPMPLQRTFLPLESEPQESILESLATFYRNGYIRWIESAKRPNAQRTDC